MTKTGETTRRGFMAAIGVGAAALAVPAGAVEATTGQARFAAGTWRQAVASWPAAVETMKAATEAVLEQFRPVYLAEVERIAEELRPRFEAGDLRAALGDPDTIEGEDAEHAARDRIEAFCSERFGLEVDDTDRENPSGDELLGRMICRVSPSAPEWDCEDGYDGDWYHPCSAAEACVGSDVIAYAKGRGWGVRS